MALVDRTWNIGDMVNYWNYHWSAFGIMAFDFSSIYNILYNVGYRPISYNLNDLSFCIYDFNYVPIVVTPKCFSQNSAVLLSDLTWKMLPDIKAGDILFTSSGPSPVKELHKTVMGFRSMYEMFDGSLSFTSDHMIWVKRNEGDYFWTAHKEDLETCMLLGNTPILNDVNKVYVGSIDREEQFAHVSNNGWISNKPVLTNIKATNYPVYSPIVENGGLIVVNGYLVDSSIDESKYDYNFNWENILTDEIKNSIGPLPIQVKNYIDFRKQNPNLIP